jgi:hypothetical protein
MEIRAKYKVFVYMSCYTTDFTVSDEGKKWLSEKETARNRKKETKVKGKRESVIGEMINNRVKG